MTAAEDRAALAADQREARDDRGSKFATAIPTPRRHDQTAVAAGKLNRFALFAQGSRTCEMQAVPGPDWVSGESALKTISV
jgi:hypothetical protein